MSKSQISNFYYSNQYRVLIKISRLINEGINKIILSSFWLLLCFFSVRAETATSSSFVLQTSDFNSGTASISGTNLLMTNTIGQPFSSSYGQYGMSNFFVGSGVQYLYPSHRFSLKISNLIVDFGDIYFDQFYQRQSDLQIDAYNTGGFSLYAIANHPLRQSSGVIIPNTTCDNNCSINSAGLWQNLDSFGFGFNVENKTKTNDFVTNNYFRPFTNQSLNQNLSLIAYSDNNEIGQTDLIINYRLNVSGLQESGSYQNSLFFVALPNY